MVRNAGRVTRFVVMAVLQAARAKALGLEEPAAFSWGLNRAIFYAAAKKGFSQTAGTTADGAGTRSAQPSGERFRLGQDEAVRDPTAATLVFTIGGEAQTAEKFEASVVARFGTRENFARAWSEAAQLVGAFPRATLESPSGFYGEVYRPRRDELSDSWTERFSPPRPSTPKRKPPTTKGRRPSR